MFKFRRTNDQLAVTSTWRLHFWGSIFLGGVSFRCEKQEPAVQSRVGFGLTLSEPVEIGEGDRFSRNKRKNSFASGRREAVTRLAGGSWWFMSLLDESHWNTVLYSGTSEL